jgi:quercetin dioxygenase-like cupin family protein
MSAITRPLEGHDTLHIRLDDEYDALRSSAALAHTGRSARTLIKDGPLRVTLIALAPGGTMAEHQADGPITVQPIQGRITFHVGETTHELRPGDLLTVHGGVRHSVESATGGMFLLTLAIAVFPGQAPG